MLAYFDLAILICTTGKEGFSSLLAPLAWIIHLSSVLPHTLHFPHYSTCCTVISLCLSAPPLIPEFLRMSHPLLSSHC